MNNRILQILTSSVLAIGLFFLSGVGSRAEAATDAASCPMAPVVEAFTPYVYPDGDLHSFDYLVTGEGFPMAAVVVVDGRPLDHRYSTTWQTGSTSSRKVHVDVPNWDGFSKNVKVSVSIWPISNPGCSTQKDFVVSLPAPKPPKFVQAVPVHVKPSADGTVPMKPAVTVTPSSEADEGDGSDQGPVDAMAGAEDGEKRGRDGSFFKALFTSLLGNKAATAACKSWPLAAWVFLAIIVIVCVIVIIDSLPYLLSGNGVRFAVALLGVFLVMLALWFIFDTCREHRWFPLVVTLIVLGTLIMPTTFEGRRGKTKKFDF